MSHDPLAVPPTPSPDDGRRSRRRIICAVLLIGLCLSLVGARRWSLNAERREREQFQSLTTLRNSYVESTLIRYGDLLANLSAFVAVSDDGAEGYASFVASQRLDWLAGIDNTGFVTTLGSRTQVRFTAPHPQRTPVGHNLSEHPRRKAALVAAVDSGQPTVGPVGEISIPEDEDRGGARLIEMFMAVYEPGPPPTTVEERRERHIGWVAVTADLEEMVRQLAVEDHELDMAVHFGDTGEVLGENSPGAAERIRGAGMSAETPIALSNRPLVLRTAFSSAHERPQSGLFVFNIGMVITVLSAYGISVTHRHRTMLQETAAAEHRRADIMSSRFYSAVAEAPVGVVVTDNQGKVVLINKRLRSLMGAPDEADDSIFDYVHDDDREFILDRFHGLTVGTLDRMETERELVCHDGSRLWCRITASNVRDEAGESAGIVAHVEDIATERQAAEELRSRERWFSSIVEHARDLIVLIDRNGSVKWASPWLVQAFGVAAEDLQGTSILDAIHSEDRERVAEAIRLVGSGESVQVEYRLTSDGETVWMESTAVNRLDDPDVAAIITVSRDVTERHRTAQILAHRASHDALTGLLNRSELDLRLTAALKEAQEDGRPICLAFLDIDMFKDLNDALGHRAGDQVLQMLAAAIRSEVRKEDLVARIGGDEMVIGLIDTDVEHAVAILERIRQRIRSAGMPAASGARPATISIGMAAAEAGDDVATLLHRADMALYESKRSGRDRLTVHRGGFADAG